MRDILEDIFLNQPLDPMEAARRNARPALRRRFYEAATVETGDGGAFRIALDGKPVRTPARRALALPTRDLAQAVADEWMAQADVIDPAAMPLTRLANTIIDGVSAARAEVAAEVEKYLRTDLLFYRAEHPEALAARQGERWDPILAWARDTLGARFVLTAGIMHVAQPDHAVAAAAQAIPQDLWRLGAVSAITTISGSALIALALAHGALSPDAAWAAAQVDEDWNAETWGRDDLAESRNAFRRAELLAAAKVLDLAG